MYKEWTKAVFAVWLVLFSLTFLPTNRMNPMVLVVVAAIYFILVMMAKIGKKKKD